ncbi:MAG: hypothetical protein VW362_12525 [Candidatus Nanopelagicales bacterium]
MADFIAEHHPHTWPRIYLEQVTTTLTVTTRTPSGDEAWVAVVWLTPIFSHSGNVVEFHICAAPEYRGRWVTRDVLDIGIPWLNQFDYVLAVHTDQKLKSALRKLKFDTSAEHMNVRKRDDTWDF